MYGNKKNYLLAFVSSMSYSYWLIGSSFLISTSLGHYYYFSLFIIMFISFILSIIFFKGIKKIPLLAVFSGIMFAIGNLLLFILIGKINVAIAGSFAALNLVFFPLLIYSGMKKNFKQHLIGSTIIATGLIIESLAMYKFTTDFLPISICIGIILGLTYALATLFFNNSLIKEKEIKNTISVIFLTESVIYGIFLIVLKNFPNIEDFNTFSIINILLISLSVFVGIFLEANGFKGIKKSGFSKRNTVNILSNLELLPVVILLMLEFSNYFYFYVIGIILIIIGMYVISAR